jgi:CO dehydrogenase/acetyl-CoA synthase epsilon subunit
MKIPDQLVISPVNSREKIESLIQEAKKDIVIYTQTLSDENVIKLIKKAQSEGITLEICTAKNESNLEQENKSGLNWKTITKPYVHTKLILIDSEMVFV